MGKRNLQANVGRSIPQEVSPTAEWLEVRALLSSAGDLDTAFDSDGKLLTDIGGTEDVASDVAIQADGKIVVVGTGGGSGPSNTDFVLARYLSDGSLDTTFNGNGKVDTGFVNANNETGRALVIQNDGKLVVAGSTDSLIAVLRYNSNGSLDTSFSDDGINASFSGIATDVALQSDGKIIAAGVNGNSFVVVRHLSDGTLDTSFDSDGRAEVAMGSIVEPVVGVAIQADGKIVVAGNSNEDFAVIRLNSDGSLDTSFDNDGIAIVSNGGIERARSVVIQPDGKIVVTGSATVGGSGVDFAAVRFQTDGSLDTGFNSVGIATTAISSLNDESYAVVLQPNGKIVAVGYAFDATRIGVVRYNANGSLDASFNNDGIQTTEFIAGDHRAFGVAIQPDGKIVVVGSNFADFAVARYLGDQSDYGDAPDTATGTGSGNYNTLSTDNGPNHTIVAGLFLGARVDGEVQALPNARANGDDVNQALPDDEDGLNNPVADLTLTVGTQPTVNVIVTNTTGSAATLFGWIDYNANGVFDNATERASVSVPNGANKGIVTLTFPVVPAGFTGTTYARFRLSTDSAAANPTGAASDGEVEDYVVTITRPGDGTAASTLKIASALNGGPTLATGDSFGSSVTSLGDLDGDGVNDLAVGASGDKTGGTIVGTGIAPVGAVYVSFMNADGTVRSRTKIASGMNGAPTLQNGEQFGSSLASLGDLDGDGINDLAVGAIGARGINTAQGSVFVLFMNTNGTVKSSTKIASGLNGGPTLSTYDSFGTSVTSLGDLDGDGVNDLAVGAIGDANYHGAVYVLLMNANGTAKSTTKFTNANEQFGNGVASSGDFDGDGVGDLVVAARAGTEYLLLLNGNGTLKSMSTLGGFGKTVVSLGDFDGDGVTDLAVGNKYDDSFKGALNLVFLNANGTVKRSTQIGNGSGGGPALSSEEQFGFSVAAIGDLNGDGVVELAVGSRAGAGTVYVLFMKPVPIDFGDAPDTGAGTGHGNYNTLSTDNGPSHTIVSGLFMGAVVDPDSGTLQNAPANADDVNGALPDDEDGLNNPLADLTLTIGAAPSVNVLVTNTTGSTATLYGWIDYNADGVFDNATERASVSVPTGSNNVIKTLTFPAVPSGFTGTTYARFRLSTDTAAANPTGAASDGEVEDYVATITKPSSTPVDTAKTKRISDETNGGPTLASRDYFGGSSVASLGDLDGDGVTDLAVGAVNDDTGGTNRGAVYVLLMNSNGTVKSTTKIASATGGGPTLSNSDYFGAAVTTLGDLDGDGVTDLGVGAFDDDTGGTDRGAVYVFLMNSTGTVKSFTKIASGTGGGPTLVSGDNFGRSVAAIGDLNGDGVIDLAVGAPNDGSGSYRGAVHVLFMNSNGTVKSSTKIASNSGGGPPTVDVDQFGISVASMGDLDGDGLSDLVVGSRDHTVGDRGAVHVLFMNSNGTVKSFTKIGSGVGGGPTLVEGDAFGNSVSAVGDLDGNGVTDLIVGAPGDETGVGSAATGAVYVLLMNSTGTVKSSSKIANNTGGGPSLDNSDFFGDSVASLGDLDGDGVTDFVVGAECDPTGPQKRGAVYVLHLTSPRPDRGDAPDTATGTGSGNYNTLSTDNGPSHGSAAGFGLRLGANVDGESEAVPNAAANGDDKTTAPDDEDGLNNPLADLTLTIGAAPTVNVFVTNTTGSTATLFGWIDYNHNGVFDNSTERASVAVTNGINKGIVTLTFPVVPAGFTGTTYARFRLSTDAAAANPTGSASDGEVEDYVATITKPGEGTVASFSKIASGVSGGPTLADTDFFGYVVGSIGDLDNDGVTDLAVGVPHDDTGGNNRGAVYLLLMKVDGSVKTFTKIASGTSGVPTIQNDKQFGSSVAAIGDLDGDGVTELAVGVGDNPGVVCVLFLRTDGTVKNSTTIGNLTNGGPSLLTGDAFGSAITSLGDLDGDGVPDLAVGASGDDIGGTYSGAIYILLMKSDGTVKTSAKIAAGTPNAPPLTGNIGFGDSIASLGDLNGDGVTEIAVGADGDDTGGHDRGAVYVLFLNRDGSLQSGSKKIASGEGGAPALADEDQFGTSLASLGDLNGDGVTDLAVGAIQQDGSGGGSVHVLFLNSDGTVKSSKKIASGIGGGPTLANGDYFGKAIASLGDLNGDGIIDLAVGSQLADEGGMDRGSVHILFLNPANQAPAITSSATASVAANTTAVLTVTATDADLPAQTLSFSIIGGADQNKFDITSGGVLTFKSAPDFESPTDAGTNPPNPDNIYEVTVQVSDGNGGTATQPISVTVTDSHPVITVGTTNDIVDGDTSSVANLIANKGADGFISLREAIIAANHASGTDELMLPAGTYVLSLAGTGENAAATGDLDITDALTITGAGLSLTTVSANHIDRVFQVIGNSTTTTMTGVSITNGDAGSEDGGGILSGGPLTITAVRVSGNSASDGAGISTVSAVLLMADSVVSDNHSTIFGGGIRNDGSTITVNNSLITGNSAVKSGGAIETFRFGTLTLNESTVSGNTAGIFSGGINNNGVLIVNRSTISDNSAQFGGGIASGSGTVTIADSTLSNNSATQGGALYNNHFFPQQYPSSAVTLINTTISGNTATAFGGGIFSATSGAGSVATVVVVNSTLFGNQAATGGGVFNTLNGSVSVANTILAGNSDNSGNIDLLGAFASLGHNLIGAVGTATGFANGVNGDLVGGGGNPVIDPRLGPLSDNGGPTKTHALLFGSPALNAGIALTTLSAAVMDTTTTSISVADATFIAAGVLIRIDSEILSVTSISGSTLTVTRGQNGTTATTHNSGAKLQLAFDQRGSGFVRLAGTFVDIGAFEQQLPNFVIKGVAAGDHSGYSVGSAGDINGDGFDDLVIGAPIASPNGTRSGASYVVFGKASGFAASLNLSSLDGTNGFAVIGGGAGDGSGVAVSGAGDINGDGFDDLVIGAYYADPNGDKSGATYVVFGKSSGFSASLNLSTLNGTNGFVLNGVAAGDLSGISISGAGDINGDGFSDIVIGAPYADTNGDKSGATYVVFGKSSGFAASLNLSALNGTNGFVVNGVAAGDLSGLSVSGAGDVNGDGLDDLVIGAFRASPNGHFSGASYVVFGQASGLSASLNLSSLDGTNGFVVNGVAAEDRSGRSVSGAGDLNGDGFDDLVIGAYYADPNGSKSGASYIVFGKASGFAASLNLSTLDGNNGFVVNGIAEDDWSARSVSGAGDLNGDGFYDLVIGAPYADPNPSGNVSGASYVVFGKASGFAASLNLSTLDGTNGFEVSSVAIGDYSGRSIGRAGDINGDGFDDLVIGAPTSDSNGSDSGATYVVFGSNFTGAVTHLGDANANSLIGTSGANVFVGEQANDTLVGSGGADIQRGGQGNDVLAVSDLTFQKVVGGTGSDTLRLDTSGVTLDLTTIPDNKITSIETIDIRGSGANTLTLNQREVLNISERSNTLIVRRDANDTVNLGSGWIFAAAETIDAELYSVYTQGAATLKVTNQPPAFSSSSSPNVAENTTDVLTVMATDTDLPAQTLGFSIVGGADQSKFDITSGGVLTFKSAPDFENPTDAGTNPPNPDNIYEVTVQVSDSNGGTATQPITVTVADENDVTPVVTANQSFNVTENSTATTAVGTVLATDGDVTATTFQSWTITAGNTDKDGDSTLPFAINASTGKITVNDAGDLDREQTSSFTLSVTVSDGVNTSAAQTVTVNLTDVNDVTPVVTAGQSFSVAENSAATTAVGTVLATDGDVTATTFQSWTITAGNTDKDGDSTLPFAINASTGAITVNDAGDLDREQTASFTLSVTVSDGANTSAAQTVTINLTDVNDVTPVVTVNQSFNLAENSAATTAVGTVLATDGDVTATTFQSWTITAGNTDKDGDSTLPFAINATTGAITVNDAGDLDREQTTSFTLSVTVSDGVNTSAAQTVAINLTDVNDLTPVVTANQSFNVAENSAATTAVGTVLATDGDVTATTFQDWIITAGNTDKDGDSTLPFAINAATGAITVNDAGDLDREQTASFTLSVTVSDGVHTSAAQTVTVNLTDVNDVTPVVTANQSVSVAENSAATTAVGTVLATDGDVTATTFQSWTITAGNTDKDGDSTLPFAINVSTGAITINDAGDLDREQTMGFTLSVTVSDGVNTSAAQTVTINLTDVNDVTPVVTTNQSFNVAENSAATTAVGTVLATDGDVTATTFQSWTITAGNTDKDGDSTLPFAINASTGAITVNDAGDLDREQTSSFMLSVTVSDGVHTSSAQTVTITMTDENDVTPVVTADQIFSVAENSAATTVVGTVLATDGDVTATTFQDWTITAGNTDRDGDSNLPFAINAATGAITVNDAGDLDREQTSSFTLSVTVSDGGNTSAAQTATVNLTDVNDVTPVVTANQSFNVAENSVTTTAVGTVLATDGDVTATTFQSWTITAGNTDKDGDSTLPFAINVSTGAITVNDAGDLDREQTGSFTLSVTVSDGVNTSAAQTVTINLTDVNDVTPVVTANQSFSVAENSVATTAVGTVLATDGDVTATTFQNWMITAGNTDKDGDSVLPFAINASTGAITVNDAGDLDREQTISFTLSVTVSDGVNTSAAQAVTINLTDENDVTPIVTANQSFDVAENSATTTAVGTVLATDEDVTATTFQSWTITAGNTDKDGDSTLPFAINASTGAITVNDAGDLDREQTASFMLSVTVSDGINTSAAQTVTVNLTDVNDVTPVVTANQSFNVTENSTATTAVGTVLATDGDVTATTFQSWTITAGNTDKDGDSALPFAINASTGAITVNDAGDLDREQTTSFTLSITVSDGVNTSAAQTVTINLTDVNDVTPVITANQSFGVAENSAATTAVGTVLATDGDVTATTFQSWTITAGNTDKDGDSTLPFAINASTGVITVNDAEDLDREQTASFTLSVTVSDGVNTSAAQTVTINLTDVNDVTPVVTANQSFNVAENSAATTTVGTLLATDGDVTATTFQSWTITAGNTDEDGDSTLPFAINASTGAITVNDAGDLDREQTASFMLSVTVSDGVNTSTAQTVTVNLTDVNDVTSVVTAGQSFNVAENSATTTAVGTVLATDGDVTATTFQNWTITAGNTDKDGDSTLPFAINASTGAISVNDAGDLDREQTASFMLSVTVSDGVNTSAAQTVTINLTDVNDVTPVITANQSFGVAENSAATTAVGTVLATDGDVTATTFQSWTITAGNTDKDGDSTLPFAINVSTGAITINDAGDLDREQTTGFTLSVTVSDGVNTSAAQTVTINLTDVNEFNPTVSGGPFSVAENSANGTAVGTVSGSDSDATNGGLSYSITGGNSLGIFAINSSSGTITVLDPTNLDREAILSVTLTVQVSDSGPGSARTGSTDVTINLIDMNEFDPVLNDASFSVTENSANGSSVGTLTATDADATRTLSYSIVAGNGLGIFSINSSTGTIKIANNANLDREAVESVALTVQVSDSGPGAARTDTAAVTINVTDVNEFDPVLNEANFSIAENSDNGTSVGTVSASDSDATKSFSYSITSGNGLGLFAINSATGEITVANSANLDRESVVSVTLTVQLSDGGPGTARTDSTAVIINVADVNEFDPVLNDASFSIAENSADGSSVGSVTGMDADATRTISYSITEGNSLGIFAINSATGEITIADKTNLNRESFASVTLTVQVSDGGPGTARTDTAAVTIGVTDVNEFAPVLDDATLSVAENSANNTSVGTVTASDSDATKNFSYSITAGNSLGIFAIDSATGTIRVADKTSLNRETLSSVSLTVQVSDGGPGTAQTDTATVIINVTEVNDAPTGVNDLRTSVLEDSGVIVMSFADLLVNDIRGPSTESGQTMTITAVSDPLGGSVAIRGTNVEFTPAHDFNGMARFTYTLQDDGTTNGVSDFQTSTATVSIPITAINDVPSFSAGANVTRLGDGAQKTVMGWATNISRGATDEVDQTMNFVMTTNNTAMFATNGLPTIDPNTGNLTFTPRAGAAGTGTATVTVRLHDSGGGIGPNVDLSAAQTFTITMTGLNRAPSFTKGPNQPASGQPLVLEDSGLQTVTNWATAISPGIGENAIGQVLNFVVTNNNNALFTTQGQPAISADGTLTYTLADNVSGLATVTVILHDDGLRLGGAAARDSSAAQTFRIMVTPVNDAPSFTKGDDQTVLEDAVAQSVTNWATSINKGAANESTQVLTFVVTNNNNSLFATQPVITAAGKLTYKPAANANGSAFVTVRLQDNGGIANGGTNTSADQTFTINVTAVNDAPTITVPIAQTTNEDINKLIPAMTVADLDATSLDVTLAVAHGRITLGTVTGLTFQNGTTNGSATVEFQGSKANVNAALATINDLPDHDFNGSDTLTATVSDLGATGISGVLMASKTVAITVKSVNDAPSFTKGDDQTVNDDDGVQSIANWATLLDPGAANESSQTLKFTVTTDNKALFATQPAVSPNGTLTFKPNLEVAGIATVTVKLSDNGGKANGGIDTSAAQTFTITVTDQSVDLTATLPDGGDTVTVLRDGNNLVVRRGTTDLVSPTRVEDVGLLTINGGSGGDRVTLDASLNTAGPAKFRFNGNIQFNGNAGDDVFDGSKYNGTTAKAGVKFEGGDGNDSVLGSGGKDTLAGGNGNDTLKGLGGDDAITGGNDNDALLGGDGDDQLDGGDQSDTVIGGAGKDTLHGGDGDDTVIGGLGVDLVFGDVGNDLGLGGRGGAPRGNGQRDAGDVLDASLESINEAFATLFAFEI